jgi:fibro-slime domain-containing protein
MEAGRFPLIALVAALCACALPAAAQAQDPPPSITLDGTVRDFKFDHPDFENYGGDDRGIVQTQLGVDDKPVYNAANANPTVTSEASFNQWFRDVAGVNQSFPHSITLARQGTGTPATYSYSSSAFFPADGLGWGHEGWNHNFAFTFELHTQFTYSGGETFSFSGDDDVFVFINRRLAVDLGGVHAEQSTNVDLDAAAATLGITPGGTYELDLFFAERHTTGSNFRMTTTLDLSTAPPKDVVAGTGQIAGGNTFVFDAESDPDGSNPAGTISFETATERIAGDVVCLNVVGDRATIAYEDTDPPAKTGGTVGGIIRVDDGSPDAQRNGRLARRKLEQYRAGGCPDPGTDPLNPLLGGVGFEVVDE